MNLPVVEPQDHILLAHSSLLHSDFAQLLINPESSQLEAANLKANNEFGIRAGADLCTIFRSWPEFISLSEAALNAGPQWSDAISIGDHEVEIFCEAFQFNSKPYLSVRLEKTEAAIKRRNQLDAQRHYRSGLSHWRHTQKIFQEFEFENRLILEAAGEGIYGVDADGLTTFVNPAAERILGWKAEELIGKNMHLTIHFHHEDGSHFPSVECPIYEAFREGEVRAIENDVFWRKDGKTVNVEYTSTPIRDAGVVIGAVIVFRDITEKKLAKEKLMTALTEVDRLREKLELENAYLQEELNYEFNHHHIIGKSQAIRELLERIDLVAQTNATVLVTGESGTGKELIARAIHDSSDRAARSLIRVNCAAVPDELFESEFFGHVKGSFTGAVSTRPGRFELADGGTLFLDEVGEIPLALQAKLLRVLQEHQFERIGDTQTREVDVRIIAATNCNLRELVEQGKFREDLYFRLNVFPIQSAPLRERKDDIPMLAQHFLHRTCERNHKQDLKIPLSEIERLQDYNWPGNIRELENLIEREVILSRSEILRFSTLPNGSPQQSSTQTEMHRIQTEAELKAHEKRNVIKALQVAEGKIFGTDGAATLLGMKPTTLASKLKKLNINAADYKVTQAEPC